MCRLDSPGDRIVKFLYSFGVANTREIKDATGLDKSAIWSASRSILNRNMIYEAGSEIVENHNINGHMRKSEVLIYALCNQAEIKEYYSLGLPTDKGKDQADNTQSLIATKKRIKINLLKELLKNMHGQPKDIMMGIINDYQEK